MSDIRTIEHDEQRKRFVVSPDWSSAIPYWLTPERSTGVSLSANGTGVVPLPLRHDGVFRGEYLLVRSTGNYLLRMNAGNYRFCNNDVPVLGALVASGFIGRPAILPEAIYLQYGQMISMDVQDLSGAPNTLTVAIAGLLYVPVRFGTEGIRQRVRDEIYRYDWLRPHWSAPDGSGLGISVPAGGQADFQFTIDQTGYLEVSKIGIYASNLTVLTIQIYDPGDRSLSSFRLDCSLFGGTAEYPAILPVKWGLLPNSKVFGTIYNSGATDQTVFLALIGRRLLGHVEKR